MTRLSSVPAAPPDPILSLTEAFKADDNPQRVNLSVGVFVDDSGQTPTPPSVSEAEARLAKAKESKSYLPIDGEPGFVKAAQALCFGDDLRGSLDGRIATLQTPGGTAALRLAADFAARNLSKPAVWLSDPTWANHKGVFEAAGLSVQTYPYLDTGAMELRADALFEALQSVPAGDIVVLHACCHNPTGADLPPEQWKEVARLARKSGWLPLLDFAYQGFGDGVEIDATAVRTLAREGLEFLAAQSFSKNFGLYQERLGALHLVAEDADSADRCLSQLKIAARVNWSNPPAHGGAVVRTILEDEALAEQWRGELDGMRSRIRKVREQFVQALAQAGVERDFSFLLRQKGMFSYTGLTKEQVQTLRANSGIYIVDSGRVNVAGLSSANMAYVAEALRGLLA